MSDPDFHAWQRFRKKPVEVHAYKAPTSGRIDTLEGTMEYHAGDYIVQGIAGELYPCRADIFEASHEPIE